uniref:Coronin n=1 Tax=Anas platyrhynchos platyrhynchos TaxID=8840 RepID=A0A493TLI7_ANAPP
MSVVKPEPKLGGGTSRRGERSCGVLRAPRGAAWRLADVVTDFDFSPFDQLLLATGSADETVKVWRLPESGQDVPSSAGLTLGPGGGPVDVLQFHPTADGVLASGAGKRVTVWDVGQQQPLAALEPHGDQLQSLAWKRDGRLLGTSCKDKKLRIFDPRAGPAASQSVPGHENNKDSRLLWMGASDCLISVGFSQVRSSLLGISHPVPGPRRGGPTRLLGASPGSCPARRSQSKGTPSCFAGCRERTWGQLHSHECRIFVPADARAGGEAVGHAQVQRRDLHLDAGHLARLQRPRVHPAARVRLRPAVPAVIRDPRHHHHQQQHGGQRGDDHQGEVVVLALGDGRVLLVGQLQGVRLDAELLLGHLLPQRPDADSLRFGLDVVLQVHLQGRAAHLRDADPPARRRRLGARGWRRPLHLFLLLAVRPGKALWAQALQVAACVQLAGAAVQARARGADLRRGAAGDRGDAEGHRHGAAGGGSDLRGGSGGAGLRRGAAAGGERRGGPQRGGARRGGGGGGSGGGGGAAEVGVLQVVEELAGVFGGEVAARLLGPPEDHAAGVHPLHEPAHLADAVEGVAGGRHGPQPGEKAGEVPRDGVDVEVADVQLLEVVKALEILCRQLGDLGIAGQAELGEAPQAPQHGRDALQQVVGDVQLVEVVLGLEELLVQARQAQPRDLQRLDVDGVEGPGCDSRDLVPADVQQQEVEPLQQPQPVEGLVGDLLQLVGGQVQVDELREGLEDVLLDAGDLVLGEVQELKGGQPREAVLAEHGDAVLKDVQGEGVGGAAPGARCGPVWRRTGWFWGPGTGSQRDMPAPAPRGPRAAACKGPAGSWCQLCGRERFA